MVESLQEKQKNRLSALTLFVANRERTANDNQQALDPTLVLQILESLQQQIDQQPAQVDYAVQIASLNSKIDALKDKVKKLDRPWWKRLFG